MSRPEVMTSESQERMLVIVTPGDLAAVREVCGRWEIRASVIGGTRHGRRAACGCSTARRRGARGRARGRPRARTSRSTTGRAVPGDHRRGSSPRRAARAPALRRGSSRCCATRPGSTASTTTSCSSTRSRPGRRRGGAAPQGPGPPRHPAGASRSAPMATPAGARSTRGPGRRSPSPSRPERRLRRSPAGRARQLPQLRQPRASRGDVAALVGGRRDRRRVPRLRPPRDRRQREPLQREHGDDIDPTPVVAVLGVIDHLERRPPGVRLVEGAAIVLLGERGRHPSHLGRPRSAGRGGRWSGGVTATALCPPSTWPATPGWSSWSRPGG